MNRQVIFETVRPWVPNGKFTPDMVSALDRAIDEAMGIDKPVRQLATPATFFSGVRAVTGPLDGVQVEIINNLLSFASHWSIAWLAYGLATAWHEARLRPIEEIGKGRGRAYALPGKHNDQIAYGRGLVQLTWDYNYQKADDELCLGGALTSDYSRALDPIIACKILVRGMEEGWFTGKSLSRYLPDELGTVPQFRDARRIINGTDKAALIAEHARKFQDALVLGKWA